VVINSIVVDRIGPFSEAVGEGTEGWVVGCVAEIIWSVTAQARDDESNALQSEYPHLLADQDDEVHGLKANTTRFYERVGPRDMVTGKVLDFAVGA